MMMVESKQSGIGGGKRAALVVIILVAALVIATLLMSVDAWRGRVNPTVVNQPPATQVPPAPAT